MKRVREYNIRARAVGMPSEVAVHIVSTIGYLGALIGLTGRHVQGSLCHEKQVDVGFHGPDLLTDFVHVLNEAHILLQKCVFAMRISFLTRGFDTSPISLGTTNEIDAGLGYTSSKLKEGVFAYARGGANEDCDEAIRERRLYGGIASLDTL